MAHPQKPALGLTDAEMLEAMKECPWRLPPSVRASTPKAPPAAAPAPETDPRKITDTEFSAALKAGAWRNA